MDHCLAAAASLLILLSVSASALDAGIENPGDTSRSLDRRTKMFERARDVAGDMISRWSSPEPGSSMRSRQLVNDPRQRDWGRNVYNCGSNGDAASQVDSSVGGALCSDCDDSVVHRARENSAQLDIEEAHK